MRILIPILGFGPAGGYRVLSELANAWQNLGHDCAFLVPSTSQQPYFPTNAEIIRVDRKGQIRSDYKQEKATGLNNILCLRAGLKNVGARFDIIIANHSLTAWPVAFTRTGKAKKFYYIQAQEPLYYPFHQTPIKHILARFSYLLKLQQISNTEIYDVWGLDPIGIVPPGIDLSIFWEKDPRGTFRTEDQIILGTIGRTEPHKGTETAIAAYRQLKRAHPKLHMNVAIGNVEPADDITITPIANDTDLAAFYRSIDILVVAGSGQFGAPHYPVMEAMASGTPVVQTDYFPGTADNTWLASKPDAQTVGKAIQACLEASEEERKAKVEKARQRVEQDLGWDVIGKTFASYFSS